MIRYRCDYETLRGRKKIKLEKMRFLVLLSFVLALDDGSDYYGKLGVEKDATLKVS